MSFELAPVDGLSEDELKEMANLFAAKCQKAAQQTVKDAIVAGNALNEIKARMKGHWMSWLKQNFDYSHKTAMTYMTLAENLKRFNFEEVTSIRAALRAIAEEKEEPATEVTPRAQRVANRVEVPKPVKSNQSADVNEKVDARTVDNDPNPAPRTNTLHRAATAKAKEAHRPVPAVVTPEIVDEPAPVAVDPVQEWIRSHSLGDLVAAVVDQLEDDVAKRKAAAELRKLADKLDPPKVDKTPSKSQLIAMIPDDWAPELQRAAADWAEYKKARAKGELIQTIRAWELALQQFTTQPSKEVIAKVNKAIENSWKGWNHDSATGNRNSGGKVTTGRIKPAADEPKITYV